MGQVKEMLVGTPRLLIADDDRDVLEALSLLLKGEGFAIEAAASPAGVLAAIEARDFDAALIDMNYARDTTSGVEGLDLITRLQLLDSTLPILVMTAWGSIEGAVEAMRLGARDYIEKPWDNVRLLRALHTQVELSRALRRARRLEDENQALQGEGFPDFLAEAATMHPVLRLMERVAPSEANVLITGEHGTGKELVARWLHAASARAGRPLVTVNLAGLAEGVFESELFGHVRGAFTDAKTDRAGRFEVAEGGTIFLDEIGALTPSQQAKLLRVLQTGEFERVGSSKTRRADVRMLAATNADLSADVAAGRFREDLFFRINTIEIRVPALRDRAEDIPLLATHFLKRFTLRYRKAVARFHPDALQALLAYHWPGNVRELEHAVERAILLADGDIVRPSDLSLAGAADGAARLEAMSLEDVERLLIQKALARYGREVAPAAKALGLSRSALYRRIQRYGL
jgi:DNA-binding NtrC family response regulator